MLKLIILLIIGYGLYYVINLERPTNLLTIRIFDVGQGDSLYLRLPSKDDILIDAGPDDRVLSELGQAMPIGDRTIELLIISHNHADHIGGLRAILKQYTVNQLWISGAIHTTDEYLETLKTIRDAQIATTIVKAGDHSDSEEVSMKVLYPFDNQIGSQPEDQHDATLVTKIQYKTFCAVLTGDLSDFHEQAIIQKASERQESLDCPVLKVTHHGSNYGTSEAWLAAVTPEIGLISVGQKNRYGHPGESLVKRLHEAKVKVYRTDLNGTITVTSDGVSYWTKTEK